jgi:hypothetical protein
MSARTIALLVAGCLNLTAQTTHSVKLTWTWSQGSGAVATGFNIKRGTTQGGPYTTIATLQGTSVQTYTDATRQATVDTSRGGVVHTTRAGSDLVAGTTYFYVVTAFSANSEGAPSPEAKAVIPTAAPVKRAVMSVLNSREPLTSELAPDKAGIFRSGVWLLSADGDPASPFGDPGDIPIAGDWNGSGTTKAGVYRAANHTFLLDYYGNREFTQVYDLGVGADPTDIPVAGDWNGDGKTKVGLFRHGLWMLDYNGDGVFNADEDKTFTFGGEPGDVPVAGDWTGSGVSKIGIFRQGSWILDTQGTGAYDLAVPFVFGGVPGDIPIVGDWNGDGRTKAGVLRGAFWVLDTNGNRQYDEGQDLVFAFGGVPGDRPVAGKW